MEKITTRGFSVWIRSQDMKTRVFSGGGFYGDVFNKRI